MTLSLIIFYIIVSIVVLVVIGINVKNLYHHSCEGKLGVSSAFIFMLFAIALVIIGAISLMALINSL